jgi:hypothetical protein
VFVDEVLQKTAGNEMPSKLKIPSVIAAGKPTILFNYTLVMFPVHLLPSYN